MEAAVSYILGAAPRFDQPVSTQPELIKPGGVEPRPTDSPEVFRWVCLSRGYIRGMKRIMMTLGVLLGLYLIGRAIAELFVIDMGDPATYRDDWGGPTLIGVLLVHCGPGLVAAGLMVSAIARRRGRARATLTR